MDTTTNTQIPFITDTQYKESRDIVVINGTPYYKSTGNNSGMKDTWLPFAGVQEETRLGLNVKVHYIKLAEEKWRDKKKANNLAEGSLRKDLEKINLKWPPIYGIKPKDFYERFFNLEHLLISSILGGGYWGSNDGKVFKLFLEYNYPNFYKENKISLEKNPEKIITENNITEVNNFLQEKLNIPKIEDYQVPTGELIATPSDRHPNHQVAQALITNQGALSFPIPNASITADNLLKKHEEEQAKIKPKQRFLPQYQQPTAHSPQPTAHSPQPTAHTNITNQ